MPIWTEAFQAVLKGPKGAKKVKLPDTAEGVGQLLGVERTYKTVEQVHAMQHALADVIVSAAEERWPDLGVTPSLGSTEFEQMCWDNALTRWPGIESLAASLVEAERTMYRNDSTVRA